MSWLPLVSHSSHYPTKIHREHPRNAKTCSVSHDTTPKKYTENPRTALPPSGEKAPLRAAAAPVAPRSGLASPESQSKTLVASSCWPQHLTAEAPLGRGRGTKKIGAARCFFGVGTLFSVCVVPFFWGKPTGSQQPQPQSWGSPYLQPQPLAAPTSLRVEVHTPLFMPLVVFLVSNIRKGHLGSSA